MNQNPNPSVTLSEVLHLALPPGSRLVCGDLQLAPRVHWARVLRARPTGLGGEPGELLILSSGLFLTAGDRRALARLVTELVEAGAAAFLVVGEAPDWLIETCSEARAPLVEAASGAVPADLERAIVGLVLDRDAQLRRRAEEVNGRLLATMLSNAGLPALLEALVESTGLRAAVFDDYLTLQAVAPDDAAFGRVLSDATGAVFAREAGAPGRGGRPLTFGLTSAGTAWSGQLYPLQIEAALAGYLALLGPVGEPGDFDRLIAERVATLVAIELAKQRHVSEAVQRGRGEFLDDLLDGSFPTGEAALARALQLGYDLLSPHVPFVLRADTGRSGDGHLTAARQRRRFAEVARTVLLRHEARALAVEREGALVALVPVAAGVNVGDQVERVRVAIGRALPGIGLSAGIGATVAEPGRVEAAYRQAQQALAIAQRLLAGGRTVEHGRVGIERLLVHLLDHPELEQFTLDTLGGLLAYDLHHRGELVHTLDVFLRCNGNHVRAAAELHLHRNTLLYRLERVREILGRDLEDSDTRLALQVSLRIRGTISSDTVENEQGTRRGPSRRRRAG